MKLSARKELVAVDCGALPVSVAAAELFGSRKGAYSGAADRSGLIPAADQGALFLDEIGNLPHQVQAMLLRVVETA
jgi:transcriptional regulator with GAF, ATPase, and Fis domain